MELTVIAPPRPYTPRPQGSFSGPRPAGTFSGPRPSQPQINRRDPRLPELTGPRINEAIRAHQVRLVDADGTMVGIVSRQEAIERAVQASLDLVEVAPDAEPPVCKILDYGKFKYQEQKRQAAAKKNQKVIEIKEIKLRPGTDEGDYQVKLRSARRFLGEGDKVKVTLRFKGREITHQELGLKILLRMRADVEDAAKVEVEPRMEGRQMVMMLAPK